MTITESLDAMAAAIISSTIMQMKMVVRYIALISVIYPIPPFQAILHMEMVVQYIVGIPVISHIPLF